MGIPTRIATAAALGQRRSPLSHRQQQEDTTVTAHESSTVRVQVTSIDGNLTHPFRGAQTVADVQQFAYERLVQDKTTVPLTATSMEAGGEAVAGSQSLAALVGAAKGHGHDVDLSLALTWVSQGG
jgi:hypothetical protein